MVGAKDPFAGGARAKINTHATSPTFHSLATQLLADGHDIRTVQELSGLT